jgi:selenocysteine lyase/cysteine desulfurase
MDAAALRSEFPVLQHSAYLNAGTDGPVPSKAVQAAKLALESQEHDGRFVTHFEARHEGHTKLREAYARVLGCDVADVALKSSTSDGLGSVLAGMDLGPGDEIVTSDTEHPGLLGPLLVARQRGVTVKAVPLKQVAEAVSHSTTVVACSHVNWVNGETAPAELDEVGVPVIFDGAQGAGAIPLDMAELGCDVYAAAGQKWLCGADATGMLYVAPHFRDRVRAIAPAYMAFADAGQGLDGSLHEDARRYDTASISREGVAFTLAAIELLESYGLEAVQRQAADAAAAFAHALAERGRTVAPRDRTTLVAWEDDDPEATRDHLTAAGVVVRNLPGTRYLRASVGAWNDESDLEKLFDALPR